MTGPAHDSGSKVTAGPALITVVTGSPCAGRWSDTRADRAELQPCFICAVDDGDCRADGFVHVGRRWEVGITWPGAWFWSGDAILDGICRATVEDRYVGDAESFELSYRGACLGCGWAGEGERHDSNPAMEDALDHVLPRWREVPVVERFAHDVPPTRRERWLAEVGALYTALGLEDRYAPGSGGLIRTLCAPFRTRSHWSHEFYDVCAGVAAAPATTPAIEQLGLF